MLVQRGIPLVSLPITARLPRASGYLSLWYTLVRQELAVRYRGTLLGRIWPLLMPVLMLAVYGFVFGTVFQARWPGMAEDDHLAFAINLFAGLLVHGLLAESVGQSPSLMQRHSNFVRKVVFPLPVLVAVPLGTALYHMLFGLTLLLLVNGFWGTGWHASALVVPLVLLPFLLLLYGLALAFSALGVYLRDLSQVVTLLVVVALFTSPVFYPRDMVPQALAGIVDYNPISWPVEAARSALLHGVWPDPSGSVIYGGAALVVLALGSWIFFSLRRGFADVL